MLLLGEFGRLTARILGTLGAVAVHSAFAMVCAHSLEKRRWPALSTVGLVLFGINFVVLVLCIWWPGWGDEPLLRSMLTTAALLAAYILAIPCAALREKRRWVPTALAGLAACAIALLMALVCIWAEDTDNVVFGKATLIATFVAFSFAHTCLLGQIAAGAALDWLRQGTVVIVWVVAGLASWMLLTEPDGEIWFRLLGAAGVTDACGSLALIIMAKIRQVGKIEQLESCAARLEIVCPRCTSRQVVEAGRPTCRDCGLKFRIEIEEPRCAKCGYLQWQLTERRCPECGEAF